MGVSGVILLKAKKVKAFCLFFVGFLSSLFLASGQTISLVGDVWAPYVMDPHSGRKGFMVDIAEAAFKKSGYTVSFKILPWTRTLMEIDKGTYDGAVGIYFDQASKHGYVIPAEEIGISVNHFFVKKETNWKYHGIPSLKGIVFGIIADYNYGELNSFINDQKKAVPSSVEIVSGNAALEKNIRKLVTNRIHALVEDEIVVSFFTNQQGSSDLIKDAGIVPPANRVGIAFTPGNPKSPEYARILSNGIKELRRSGELKVILEKYLVKDWK